MGSYGQVQIAALGRARMVSAYPDMDYKAGGVTIDWSTVDAVSGSDVTLEDGTIIKVGDKYIKFGTVLTKITATRLFGPANTGASDGRQLVDNSVRGDSYILDCTVLKSDLGSDHTGQVFDGGAVFKTRLQIGGTNEPTEANIETMFPDITFVTD